MYVKGKPMPPLPIIYPSARPVSFRLDSEAVRAAAAALSERVTEPEKVAIETARIHLMGQAQLALDAGRLVLTSPRSSNRYTCTRTTCDCAAGKHGKLCWHRAAASIVRWIWDRARPLVRCPHCLGPMVAARTIGGERSVACLVCSHELPFGAVEALHLTAYSEMAARQAA
jgi:hypothetical protein